MERTFRFTTHDEALREERHRWEKLTVEERLAEGRDAFLKNKRATGRAHDLADVALLEEIERTTRG